MLSAAVLASERMLPVAEPLQPLLPSGGLVRGQVVASRGVAAVSLALALAVEATRAGSWLTVVDVPALGLEAVEELGIPLERVVRVDLPKMAASSAHPGARGDRGARWAELMAAVVDGFEVIVTRVPTDVAGSLARKVHSRLQARDAVLITLGSAGPLSPAIELRATQPRWDGLDDGAGYLRGRRVTVSASGRRVPRQRRTELWLPGPGGAIAVAEPVETGVVAIASDAGTAELAADTALAG